MRSCQKCAAPIPTSAKNCPECGEEQRTSVGGEEALTFPEVEAVADQNFEHDQRFTRFSLMLLIALSVIISLASGISVGSLLIGGSTFFVALLCLFILFQILGIDVSF